MLSHGSYLVITVIGLLTLAAGFENGGSQTVSPVLITTNHTFVQADDAWQERVSNLRAVKIEPGCGRMQNRLVTFNDGSKACARYRLNTHLMQGEIYSHIIGKLLRIPNMPPLATTLPDLKNDQWSRVGSAILEANWQSNKLVILTKYIPDTSEVVLPQQLKPMLANSLSPGDITPENRDMLAQWSDMLVFDYIVGNMDRLVSSLHNKHWNSNIMNMAVHNLARKDNSLIFFDNEDGLFHGYKILDRYSQYHEQSLKATCVFRKSTVDSIATLLQSDNMAATITTEVQHTDPRILKYLPKVSTKTINLLHKRLSNVSEHVKYCMNRYKS